MKKRYEDGIVPGSNSVARLEIATQLRQARCGLNMTQQALADKAGTKKSNISRLESGRYNPSLDFIVKIADSLGKKVTIRLD